MKSILSTFFLLALTVPAIAADVVVPIDSVKKSINVRMEADATTEVVGRLSQGSSLSFLGTTSSGWHKVQLEDDSFGYVSADWSNVISDEEFLARQESAMEPAETATVADVSPEAESQDEDDSPVADAVVAETGEFTGESTTVDDVVTVVSEPAAAEDSNSETVADLKAEPEVVEAAIENEAEEHAEVTTAIERTTDSVSNVAEVVADESAAPQPEAVDARNTSVSPTTSVFPGTTIQNGSPRPTGLDKVSTVAGTEDFLVKFTKETVGGNSQIFDNGRNVGIGTTEPKQRLEVNGNIQIHERNSSVAGLMLTQSSGDMGYIMHNRANTLTLGAGSVDRLTIDRDGFVGIGMVRPTHPIEMASGAYVSLGGVWTNSSSREKKENIVSLTPEEALAALAELQPVRFNYKQDVAEEYVGFIAEDVPGLVASKDRVSLSSMDIVAVLTKVLQEQQQKIAELEERLDASGR